MARKPMVIDALTIRMYRDAHEQAFESKVVLMHAC
jgi:hypothetical protein